jgi:hypothetical protein
MVDGERIGLYLKLTKNLSCLWVHLRGDHLKKSWRNNDYLKISKNRKNAL